MTFLNETFSLRFAVSVLHFLWQGCAILILTSVANVALRRSSAQKRYLLNCLALLAMVICFPVTFALTSDAPIGSVFSSPRKSAGHAVGLAKIPNRRVGDIVSGANAERSNMDSVTPPLKGLSRPSSTELEATSTAQQPKQIARGKTATAEADAGLVSLPRQLVRMIDGLCKGIGSYAFYVTTAYFVGLAVFLSRLIKGVSGGRQLRKHATLVEPSSTVFSFVKTQSVKVGLRIEPSLAWCQRVTVPVVVGVFRPIILIPASFASGLSPSQMEVLLAHELMHIRRFDPIVNLFQRFAECLLFFHPAVWFVSRRIGIERERATDDMVISVGHQRSGYADALVRMAELSSAFRGGKLDARDVVLAASGRSATSSEFKRRVIRVLDRGDNAAPRGLTLSGFVFVLTLLACSIGTIAAIQVAPEQSSTDAVASATRTQPKKDKPSPKTVAIRPIKGRIMMPDGVSPAADAEVRLLTWAKTKTRYKITTTFTNNKGEFTFDRVTCPDSTQANAVSDGSTLMKVAAYKNNLASRAERYDGVIVKPGDDNVALQLRAAPSLRITVAEKRMGEPLDGATVRLIWADGEREHRVDENGQVTIYGLTPEIWTFEVHATGFAEHQEAIQLTAKDMAETSVTLVPGFELSGVARDDNGEPVEGVGISVFGESGSGEQIEYVTTDTDGRYEFNFLPAEPLKLLVRGSGYDAVDANVAKAEPGEKQELDLVVKNRPINGSVTGKVTNEDGEPIVGAMVFNTGRNATLELREATTDKQGKFRINNVLKEREGYRLYVSATDYAPQRVEFVTSESDSTSAESRPGTTVADVNVTLTKGHRIRGRVVDEDGNAIRKARVRFEHEVTVPIGIDLAERVWTDDSGQFEMSSLPANGTFGFRCFRYTEIKGHVLPMDGPGRVTIEMTSDGVVLGRVLDAATEEPITSFTVETAFSPERLKGDPSGSLGGPAAFGGMKFSKNDGRFRLKDFTQNMPLQVIVSADGYVRDVKRRVVAKPTNEANVVEFRLKPLNQKELIKVSGRMVNEKSEPVANITICIIAARKRSFPRDESPFNWSGIKKGRAAKHERVLTSFQTTTDTNGRFTFENVIAAEDIELAYWGKGVSQDRTANLAKRSPKELENIELRTTTPGTVIGALDKNVFGEPRMVSLYRINDGQLGLHTELDAGHFRFEDVPPGLYSISLNYPEYLADGQKRRWGGRSFRRIAVKSGETLEVDFGSETNIQRNVDNVTRQRASSFVRDEKTTVDSSKKTLVRAGELDSQTIRIGGSITDENGEAVPNALVVLPLILPLEDKRIASTKSDEQGDYVLQFPAEWVRHGTFRKTGLVWCYAAGYHVGLGNPFEDGLQQTTASVDFLLRSADTNTQLVVFDEHEQPLEGATVEPWHFLYRIVPEPIRKVAGGTTDAKGRIALPANLGSAMVTAKGYGSQRSSFYDSADAAPIRQIKLRPTGAIEGQLVGTTEMLQAYAGKRLFIYQDVDRGRYTSGSAKTTFDADGRFSIAHFAEGPFEVVFKQEPAQSFQPRIRQNQEVLREETTRVELVFENAVRVRGRVQTSEDSNPVPNALVSMSSGLHRLQQTDVHTGSDGRFEAYLLPGTFRQNLMDKPSSYADWIAKKAGWQDPVEIPSDQESFDLPPIEIIRTYARKGRLVDANQQPIADIRVSAVAENRVYAGTMTASDGLFELKLPKQPTFKYQIHMPDAQPIFVAPKGAGDILLQLPPR